MILELSDIQSIRIDQLKIQLSKDVGEYSTKKVEESLSKFFTEHKQVFIDNNLLLPASVELDFDFQSDDEGGSNAYVSGMSLFDKDGEHIDDWNEIEVSVKSSWSDNIYTYDFEEAARDAFDVSSTDLYEETGHTFEITIG